MADNDSLIPEQSVAAAHGLILNLGIEPMNTSDMGDAEFLDQDERFEEIDVEIENANDEDYFPYAKKRSTTTTTRSKFKEKKGIQQQKRKALKKEIELPIKIDLINLVKAERSLYNLKDPLYMSRNHKEKKWSEIADAMQKKYPEMTIDKCKKMWDAVRESTR